MNVAIVIYGKSIEGGGGAERRFIRVFKKLRNDKDNRIYLVINRNLYNSFIKLNLVKSTDNIIIINDAKIFSKIIFNYQLIKLFLFNIKFNIVHLVLIQKSLIPFYFILWIYNSKKIKVVSTVANYRLAYRKGLSLFESLLYNLYIKASNHIDSLYPNIVTPKKSFSITPRPFSDYTQFKPMKKENIVLFAGRLQPYKNPRVFVKAVIQLLENNELQIVKDWRFVICGSGPLEFEITKHIEDKGFKEWFYIGNCNNIPDLMGKSKIFVSLQTYENYPSQSLIEAIVTQNNIIVTDVGDTRLLFDSGMAHFINLDSTELSKTLLDIIKNGGYSQEVLEKAASAYITSNTVESFKDYLLKVWKYVENSD